MFYVCSNRGIPSIAFLCISVCKNQEVVAFPVFSEIKMRETKIRNLFLTSIVRFLFNCKCYGLVCFHKEIIKVQEKKDQACNHLNV